MVIYICYIPNNVNRYRLQLVINWFIAIEPAAIFCLGCFSSERTWITRPPIKKSFGGIGKKCVYIAFHHRIPCCFY